MSLTLNLQFFVFLSLLIYSSLSFSHFQSYSKQLSYFLTLLLFISVSVFLCLAHGFPSSALGLPCTLSEGPTGSLRAPELGLQEAVGPLSWVCRKLPLTGLMHHTTREPRHVSQNVMEKYRHAFVKNRHVSSAKQVVANKEPEIPRGSITNVAIIIRVTKQLVLDFFRFLTFLS